MESSFQSPVADLMHFYFEILKVEIISSRFLIKESNVSEQVVLLTAAEG